MLLVQPLSTGRVFLPFPFPIRSHFSKMICDNLKNWPPKHAHKSIAHNGDKTCKTHPAQFLGGTLCAPTQNPRTFFLLVEKHLCFYKFFFNVEETEKPPHSFPLLPSTIFAPLLSQHKKETKPTQHTLVQFPKGTLLSPTQNPLVPIDEKN